LGRYKEAVECHDKSLQIDVSYRQAWNNLGRVKHLLYDYDEAIECFDRAIALDPKYFQAWHGKGMVLRDLGKHELALKCFSRVLDINPEYHVTLVNVTVVPTITTTNISQNELKRSYSLEESSAVIKRDKWKQISLETSKEYDTSTKD